MSSKLAPLKAVAKVVNEGRQGIRCHSAVVSWFDRGISGRVSVLAELQDLPRLLKPQFEVARLAMLLPGDCLTLEPVGDELDRPRLALESVL
jgi:hypothetical protein